LKEEVGWEVPMPSKPAVAIASKSCWARVQTVNMGRASEDNYVQVDAFVCPLDHANHELEFVVAFLIDLD
jgi:hypothetical protein